MSGRTPRPASPACGHVEVFAVAADGLRLKVELAAAGSCRTHLALEDALHVDPSGRVVFASSAGRILLWR